MIKRTLLTLFFIFFVFNAYPAEVITGFEQKDLPVLNEELRNIKDEISSANSAIASAIPSGLIVMWSGSIATIPSGWAICNGSNGTPDLRNRFVIAAGDTYDPGDTGDGSIPEHLHAAGTLATAADGAHTHTVAYKASGAGTYATGSADTGGGNWTTSTSTTHTHTISGSSANTGTGTKNISVYYALAYIMKL